MDSIGGWIVVVWIVVGVCIVVGFGGWVFVWCFGDVCWCFEDGDFICDIFYECLFVYNGVWVCIIVNIVYYLIVCLLFCSFVGFWIFWNRKINNCLFECLCGIVVFVNLWLVYSCGSVNLVVIIR